MEVVQAIIQVWQAIVNWFSGIWTVVSGFFWTGSALTFPGVFAVIMAGVSLILLAFNLIRSFLPMRG